MNILVSECKCYHLLLVAKYGDVHHRQNWRLHPTAGLIFNVFIAVLYVMSPFTNSSEFYAIIRGCGGRGWVLGGGGWLGGWGGVCTPARKTFLSGLRNVWPR